MNAGAAAGLPLRWTELAGLLLAGVTLGIASAWLTLDRSATFGAAVGSWRVSLLAGSAEADPTTRALVALNGLLALHRGETMYFVATTDSAGHALRARCNYRIRGTPPPARWWSVTAYGDDLYLFEDTRQRYSLNAATARLDAEGLFAAFTGPTAPADPGAVWLPTPGDRGLVLVLRVYNPGTTLQAAPASLAPPRVDRLGACP